jgi:hypothetical protein
MCSAVKKKSQVGQIDAPQGIHERYDDQPQRDEPA